MKETKDFTETAQVTRIPLENEKPRGFPEAGSKEHGWQALCSTFWIYEESGQAAAYLSSLKGSIDKIFQLISHTSSSILGRGNLPLFGNFLIG